ncbi:MAG: hypothetical protein J2P31_12210, partial [Blastocatellia bacterium]|nr:hypothetical protein [Blastocatellia bacterium]
MPTVKEGDRDDVPEFVVSALEVRAYLATILYNSGYPINMTGGTDLNHDRYLNDRPLLVGRNSITGPAIPEFDGRLVRAFLIRAQKTTFIYIEGEPRPKNSRRKFMRMTRRNFLGTAAGATAYAAFSPLHAKAQSSSSGQGLIWPPNQALPGFLPPEYLDAGNIEHLTADQQLLLTTLQGIVNRHKPRIYWFQSGDGSDEIWLNTFNIPNTVASDPLSLIATYRDEVQGAIVYDPQMPHTINIATTLAGLMDSVVASADLANQHQLPIVMDLRGRFASKLDAYNWVLENYWPQLTNRLLTGISPANASAAPGVVWTTLLQQTTHVHNSSNKADYTIDLTPFLGGDAVYVRFQNSFQNEGFGPSVQQVTVLANGNAIASFQPSTAGEQAFLYESDNSAIASGGWRFADGTTYFIYKFTPPAGTTTLTMQVLMWNQYLVTATNQAPLVYSPNARFRDYIVATQAFVFW